MNEHEELFRMPEPRAVVRNGDSLVEFTHEGQVVGHFNFSKVIRNWYSALRGTSNTKALEVSR